MVIRREVANGYRKEREEEAFVRKVIGPRYLLLRYFKVTDAQIGLLWFQTHDSSITDVTLLAGYRTETKNVFEPCPAGLWPDRLSLESNLSM